MFFFSNLKEQVESDMKLKLNTFPRRPALKRTFITGWSIIMKYVLNTCSITGTEQTSDLLPAWDIAILFLPLFSTLRYLETPDIRLESTWKTKGVSQPIPSFHDAPGNVDNLFCSYLQQLFTSPGQSTAALDINSFAPTWIGVLRTP